MPKQKPLSVDEIIEAIDSALTMPLHRDLERGVIAFLAGYFYEQPKLRDALQRILNAGDAAHAINLPR